MFVGLQGSGKTTTCTKVWNFRRAPVHSLCTTTCTCTCTWPHSHTVASDLNDSICQ